MDKFYYESPMIEILMVLSQMALAASDAVTGGSGNEIGDLIVDDWGAL